MMMMVMITIRDNEWVPFPGPVRMMPPPLMQSELLASIKYDVETKSLLMMMTEKAMVIVMVIMMMTTWDDAATKSR